MNEKEIKDVFEMGMNAPIEIFTQPGDLVVSVRNCGGSYAVIITRATPKEEGIKILSKTRCVFFSHPEAVEAVRDVLTLVTEHCKENNPFNSHVLAQYERAYAKQGLVYDPRLLFLTEDTIGLIITRLDRYQTVNTSHYIPDPAR